MSAVINVIATIVVVMFFVFFTWTKLFLPLWNDFKKHQIPIQPYDKNRPRKIIDAKKDIDWRIERGKIKWSL